MKSCWTDISWINTNQENKSKNEESRRSKCPSWGLSARACCRNIHLCEQKDHIRKHTVLIRSLQILTTIQIALLIFRHSHRQPTGQLSIILKERVKTGVERTSGIAVHVSKDTGKWLAIIQVDRETCRTKDKRNQQQYVYRTNLQHVNVSAGR